MQVIRGLLEQARPFVAVMAMVFGLLAAYSALIDLVPVIGQVWKPHIQTQSAAIVAACLALVAGRV